MTAPSLLSVLTAAVLIVACTSKVEAPKRLPGIPPDAVWVGGRDGGAWILCRDDGGRNFCTIYNDASPEVWIQAFFVLEGSSRGVSVQELRYDFFDGDRIRLVDGRVLTRMK